MQISNAKMDSEGRAVRLQILVPLDDFLEIWSANRKQFSDDTLPLNILCAVLLEWIKAGYDAMLLPMPEIKDVEEAIEQAVTQAPVKEEPTEPQTGDVEGWYVMRLHTGKGCLLFRVADGTWYSVGTDTILNKPIFYKCFPVSEIICGPVSMEEAAQALSRKGE